MDNIDPKELRMPVSEFTFQIPDKSLANSIVFNNGEFGEVGRLSFKGPLMEFTGNTDEAGRTFFSGVCRQWNAAFTEARNQGFEDGKLYGRMSPIELVMFNPKKLDGERLNGKTDFMRAYHLSKQIVEDGQMELLAGSVYDMQWLLDLAVEDIRVGDLVNAASMLLAIADRTDLLAEPLPGDCSTNPIHYLPLRDKQGCWSHPGFPWAYMDEGMDPGMILNGMGFKVEVSSMEDEVPEEAYAKMIEAADWSLWTPKNPDYQSEGWFLISISDAEDGPVALWARKFTEAELKEMRKPHERY